MTEAYSIKKSFFFILTLGFGTRLWFLLLFSLHICFSKPLSLTPKLASPYFKINAYLYQKRCVSFFLNILHNHFIILSAIFILCLSSHPPSLLPLPPFSYTNHSALVLKPQFILLPSPLKFCFSSLLLHKQTPQNIF